MKKIILPIFCVVIFVIIVSFILLTISVETGPFPEEPPMAQIKLADHIEDSMSWEHTSRLLQTLGEVGCVDVNINGFYWDCNPCLVRSHLPRYEVLDEIILPYIFKESSPRVSPDPAEQYDLNMIKDWCKRNQNKHSQIKFGSDVQFNAVRGITDIFHNHKIKFDLLFPNNKDDEKKSVIIQLYDPPIKK